MTHWLTLFLMTAAVESVVAWCLGPPGKRGLTVRTCLAANLFTHPLAWIAVVYGNADWWLTELAVVGVELLIYRTVARLEWTRCLALAGIANGLTALGWLM